MKELISLISKYDKAKHIKYVCRNTDFSTCKLEKLNSKIWEKDNSLIPYNIITYLLDSYYCFPERPDMGFLYLWQCINNIYNELQFKDINIGRSSDSKGIELFINMLQLEFPQTIIYNGKPITIEELFNQYVSKCPVKLFKFISSYLLKNYVIENNFPSLKDKLLSSSYLTFRKKNNNLFKPITNTYGRAFKNICNPQLNSNNIIDFKIVDKDKSRNIINSLAIKLSDLVNSGSTVLERESTYNLTMNLYQKIEFVFRDLVYAIRCNSFHGNIASRLNSIYADKNSFEASKYIFYISHFLINVGLINLKKMELDDICISIKNLEYNYSRK